MVKINIEVTLSKEKIGFQIQIGKTMGMGYNYYGIAFDPKCPTKTKVADVRDTIYVKIVGKACIYGNKATKTVIQYLSWLKCDDCDKNMNHFFYLESWN